MKERDARERRYSEDPPTIATPEDIKAELQFERERMARWVADGSIQRREEKVKVIARRLGLIA